ncbi:MAG: GAF domain-containing sensor histidine kinase [Cyanobacteria bacterium J06639_1]
MPSDRLSQPTSTSRQRRWAIASGLLQHRRAPVLVGATVATLGIAIGLLARVCEDRTFTRHSHEAIELESQRGESSIDALDGHPPHVSPAWFWWRLSWFLGASGFGAGAIAAAVVRLQQKYRRQSEVLSDANRALADEIRDRIRAEAALSRQIDQAALLRQLTDDVRSSLDWEYMLKVTVRALGDALNVDRCTIHVNNPEATFGLSVVADYARAPYRSAVASLLSVGTVEHTYARAVLAGDRALVSHDAFNTEWLASVNDLCQSLNVKSLLAARTSYQGIPNGAIEVHQCDRFRQWTTDEIELLEAIAAQVGIAIQQAELFRQQQQFNATLERQVTDRTAALQEALELEALLQSITERVLYERDEAQILQSVTTLLAERLQLSTCEINTVDLESSTHTVRYECARSLPSILGHTFSSDDDIASHTPFLLEGCLLYLCCTHPLVGWIAIVQCPIQDEEGIFGILNLIRPQHAEFSDAEIRLAQQVATQCAIALRQARLYEAAQQRIVDLQNLSVLKDDFLSTVSHELRSPLANMQMALKMLKLVPDPTKQQRYLDVLETACKQEAQLVDDLLDLQRLEAQCYQLAIEAIALEIWLPEVVAPFEPRARSRGLRLDVDMPQQPLELHSDRACLERILRELLTNACKYSADGGCIRVTLAAARLRSDMMPDEEREGIRLEVSNPAVIPVAELPHIFEKFYRIPKSDRWRQGGTGLGLALVKQMMEQLQGSISVTCERDTTTFSLWLPAIPEFKPKWSGELTGTVPVQRNRLAG